MRHTWKPSQAIVPVVVIHDASHAVRLSQALLRAGLSQIEITLRTDAALEAMRAIVKETPEMSVGAGTILDASVIPTLREIGVQFGVSPGLNEKVLAEAERQGLPMVPGVMTPTEVEHALALGLRTLKFFPAEAAGGVAMLKALAGPYGHTGVRFVPTGGINAEKARAYLQLPTTAAVGGSWFVSPDRIADGKFDEIERLTREALEIAEAARSR